ncbi:MAG: Hsp20/alpha crystallin family protein [Candidatus Pacebacteria bacterium]|nr:Hsp20/alpha crystallin family protein [Candidatus Paceibacterota bacterium]
MYDKDKRSFFERLTGTINVEEEEQDNEEPDEVFEEDEDKVDTTEDGSAVDIEEEEGELTVDVYEDGEALYIQAMIAGVEPDNVDVSITREKVTIRGKRVNPTHIANDKYHHKELYWGNFSREILLPEEIDPEISEAVEKHGLLILKLPKLNKKKSQKLEVHSID